MINPKPFLKHITSSHALQRRPREQVQVRFVPVSGGHRGKAYVEAGPQLMRLILKLAAFQRCMMPCEIGGCGIYFARSGHDPVLLQFC
jgi:hypothetical protein